MKNCAGRLLRGFVIFHSSFVICNWLERPVSVPVRVWFGVDYQVSVEKLAVGARLHALLPEERPKRPLQARKIVEGDPREVMVFQMIVGPEVGIVPEPARLHQSAPLSGIFRSNV